MKWISEAEQLPRVAQPVLLAIPSQGGGHWDLKIAQLLIRYEEVSPKPVPKGSRWPSDYWWDSSRDGSSTTLVTGNAWWALLDDIPLPPGAEHKTERGYHFIAQPEYVFVTQAPRVR